MCTLSRMGVTRINHFLLEGEGKLRGGKDSNRLS